MTQIKTSPPSVTVLQPLSILHETRVRLPLPKSICVALTVKPVSTTAKNMLETAQPLSTLIQKGLRSIVKRYRTVFVALRRRLTRQHQQTNINDHLPQRAQRTQRTAEAKPSLAANPRERTRMEQHRY